MLQTLIAAPCDSNRRVRCAGLAEALHARAGSAVFDLVGRHQPVKMRLSQERHTNEQRSRLRDAANSRCAAHLDDRGRLVLSTNTYRLLNAPQRILLAIDPENQVFEVWREDVAATWLRDRRANRHQANAQGDRRWADFDAVPSAHAHAEHAAERTMRCACTYGPRISRTPHTH